MEHVRTLDNVLACRTEQITWMGMQTLAKRTTNSPTNIDVPGMGEVAVPNTYSMFSEVAKPSAPAIKYTAKMIIKKIALNYCHKLLFSIIVINCCFQLLL